MGELVLRFLLLSLWGGAATLGALAVSGVLRRLHIPSRLLCWLWLAVGLRFALPWGIPLTLPRPRNENLAQAADTVQALAEGPAPVALPAVQAPAVTAAAAAPWYTRLTVWHLLAVVWAVGVLVLAVRAVAGYLRLRRTVALACKTEDGCYSGSCVPAPFTLGILRPRIYLPAALTGAARQAVVLHERTHLRRHDPQTKPLYYAVVCLHWFNPLAWLAFRQLEREMESACDEAAVRGCDAAARNAYCESILQYALQGRMAPGSLAFGQGSVKTRIVHLLHYRKIGAGALLVCAAAVGLSVTACMMQPQVEEATPETAQPAPVEATAETPDTPETAVSFTANTAGLPNLDDPENSPRFLCPVDYEYISRYMDYAHRGDDLTADTGTPVYAAQDGVVTYAEFHSSYGNCVILDHGVGLDGNRWATLYAHMDDYAVAIGQTVKAGNSSAMWGPPAIPPDLTCILSCCATVSRPSPGISQITRRRIPGPLMPKMCRCCGRKRKKRCTLRRAEQLRHPAGAAGPADDPSGRDADLPGYLDQSTSGTEEERPGGRIWKMPSRSG